MPETADQAAEIDRLQTENERMRHELEVMYGGAFDSLPATEAHPTEERFRVEIHDGGQWMRAGSPTQHKQVALDALAARRSAAKTWATDGEPVRWRVVRETVTYIVEAAP